MIKILTLFLLISIIYGLSQNSYYLINIDNNILSNESYCSKILLNQQVYRIPKQCHRHLRCHPYYCDDKSFRCIKIRETLCCLYEYFRLHCQNTNLIRIKDLFRSVYFHMSIEHGYCEINLERIEKNDQTYCIANLPETGTAVQTTKTILISATRPSFEYYHWRLPSSSPSHSNGIYHRIGTKKNYSSLTNPDYFRQVTIIETISSQCSKICRNSFLICIVLLLPILF